MAPSSSAARAGRAGSSGSASLGEIRELDASARERRRAGVGVERSEHGDVCVFGREVIGGGELAGRELVADVVRAGPARRRGSGLRRCDWRGSYFVMRS
ncbi:MAG: hypothetical protein QM760_02335 [Nibricoccus sp.]